MKIEMNFLEDLRAGFADRLRAWGYALPPRTANVQEDALRTCIDYCNASERRIPAHPRQVFWSSELRARESSLSAEVRDGLATIEQEVLTGADLSPRLSRFLKRLSYNDKMLHDWGIHHLHFGETVEDDGFVERTEDLLFVMRRPDAIYFLDVRSHGAWTDATFVEIVHSNWPLTIEQYRLAGLSAKPLSAQQRANLRARNSNACVAMPDGTIYMAIGGGLVSTGDNFRSVRWASGLVETALSLETATQELDVLALLDEIASVTGVRLSELALELGQLEDDHALIVVRNAATPFVIRVNYY